MKMKELPVSERPYEKLEMYGEKSLSNSELLAIIIKTGTKEETSVGLAQKILNLNGNKHTQDLRFLQDVSLVDFASIKGIGKVKAIQLKAVCELAKRMARPVKKLNVKIKSGQDVASLLMEEMRYEKREIAKVIALNSKNMVLKIIDVSYGGNNFAMLEPKEILLEAIKCDTPKIILVHNHPSGDPTPSQADYRLTDRIYECTQMLGIELLDHIIIGDGKYESVMKNEWEQKEDLTWKEWKFKWNFLILVEKI